MQVYSQWAESELVATSRDCEVGEVGERGSAVIEGGRLSS